MQWGRRGRVRQTQSQDSKLLKDRSAVVRASAAAAFASIRAYTAETEAEIEFALRETLVDGDEEVVCSALFALGTMWDKAAPALPRIIECASHKSPHVRYMSMEAIEHIGSSATPAIPAVILALSDRSLDVRRAAIEALTKIGRDRKDVLEALKKVAGGDDEEVRGYAKEAIEKLLKPLDK
jgi:HEAT repeat protein